jgi:hypothetical protein
MNPNDTARLVNLLISTWPAGVKGHIWTDTLGPLDLEHAHATYRGLRDHDERAPSVARFLAAYHQHTAAARGDNPPPHCELCDGTGWIRAPRERAHVPEVCNPTDEHPCHCHAVEPCRCTRGQQAVQP